MECWQSQRLSRHLCGGGLVALPETFLQGRSAIREFYAPLFERGANRGTLLMEQLNVEVLSREVVLVQGIYRNTQGDETTRRGTTTLILRRTLGRWRIIHDHSS